MFKVSWIHRTCGFILTFSTLVIGLSHRSRVYCYTIQWTCQTFWMAFRLPLMRPNVWAVQHKHQLYNWVGITDWMNSWVVFSSAQKKGWHVFKHSEQNKPKPTTTYPIRTRTRSQEQKNKIQTTTFFFFPQLPTLYSDHQPHHHPWGTETKDNRMSWHPETSEALILYGSRGDGLKTNRALPSFQESERLVLGRRHHCWFWARHHLTWSSEAPWLLGLITLSEKLGHHKCRPSTQTFFF